jgi:hypothetical protein
MRYPLLALALALALAPRPAAAQVRPSPSCMLNGQPCPVPSPWAVDWSLLNSSACMPSLEGATNNASFAPAHRWGLASLDWSVGRGAWFNPRDPGASTCEATSAANCAALKAAGRVARCGVYHNMELALQWLESNRAVMYAAGTADWFLQYTDGAGHKNGTIFNARRAEGDQFFIDWRNPDAAAYFVGAIVNVTLLPGVDATFTDDREGLPVEHPTVPTELRLTPAEVAQLQFATQAAGQYLATALAANGRTCWDCLSGSNLGVRPTRGDGCAPVMRALCAPGGQGRSMFMSTGGAFADANQTVAAFLVTRPPVAFLGDRFPTDASWSPLFALDVGEPTALCAEGPPGVFSRAWTKGTASLDCNTWTAALPFALLPGYA